MDELFTRFLIVTPEQCQRLKQGRLAAYYSQKEAADALFVSPRTYEKWEQGTSNPEHIETFARIATLFNISLDWWLLGDAERTHDEKQIINGIHRLAPDDRAAVKRIIRTMAK